jgi:two-component system phosphate regulon response regulator OmpR
MQKHVLTVDDDPVLQHLLSGILRSAGYSVQQASNLQQAILSVQRQLPDAAIVDVELGQSESGLNLLGIWRANFDFPIMVLSSRGTASDRIVGLELGALDYMAKPFDPRELLLRLKLMFDRQPGVNSGKPKLKKWNLGLMVFDSNHRILTLGDLVTNLSQFESELLHFLSIKVNQPATREQILNAVHSREIFVNDRAVDVLVGRLRKKLQNSNVTIKSVRGIGYMLCGDVTPT